MLFGAAKLAENANPNKYSFSRYGIGFDSRSLFSIPSFDWGKTAITFGVDMSSSVHANNKDKNIVTLGKGQTKGFNNTSPTVEAEYSVNFSRSERKFCLSLHYNGSNSFLFVNATKAHQFKTKGSKIKRYPFCLGNILNIYVSADNMKKTGLNGYVYDFSVDYIIDNHKYLIKKYYIK